MTDVTRPDHMFCYRSISKDNVIIFIVTVSSSHMQAETAILSS
jgi:hypothetical protein